MEIIAIHGKKQAGKDTTANYIRDVISKHDRTVTHQMALPIKSSLCKAWVRAQQLNNDMQYLTYADWEGLKDADVKRDDVLNASLQDIQRVLSEAYNEYAYSPLYINLQNQARTQHFDLIDKFLSDNKESGFTIRKLMQFFGTDLVRKCLSNTIWVDIADTAVRFHYKNDVKRMILTDIRNDVEVDYLQYLVDHYGANSVKVLHVINPNTETYDPHDSEKGLAKELSILPQGCIKQVINDSTLEHLYSQLDTIFSGE